MIEQTAVNIAARALNIHIALLDRTFNNTDPPDGGMRDFIYHFARMGEDERGRDARIDALDWRTVPAELQEVS
jgi:hypothetical protein